MKIYHPEAFQSLDTDAYLGTENSPGNFQSRKNTTSSTLNKAAESLFRLSNKNGEYVYLRPNDIILLESCDHFVKVYVGYNNTVRKVVRNSTLKEFLQVLPEEKFVRIGRFCALNIHRLSGGNFNTQAFEFDFTMSVKLTRAVPHRIFTIIGR